ncbi:MAG: M15 family metallopeptidase, partial [Oscillospiraceae bacterium]|nr:M15 family metallopeptidase [Oscillospiraceae bacterium]
MPYRKKRRLKIKNIVIFTILLLLILAAVIAGLAALFGGKGGEQKPSSSAAAPSVSDSAESGDPSPSSSNSVISEPDDSWQLILANPDSPVPDGFTVDLTDITGHYEDIPALDNMKVDSRIVEPLLQMFQAAKADGQKLFLRASYRTVALQQTYYDWHINHYKEQGH